MREPFQFSLPSFNISSIPMIYFSFLYWLNHLSTIFSNFSVMVSLSSLRSSNLGRSFAYFFLNLDSFFVEKKETTERFPKIYIINRIHVFNNIDFIWGNFELFRQTLFQLPKSLVFIDFQDERLLFVKIRVWNQILKLESQDFPFDWAKMRWNWPKSFFLSFWEELLQKVQISLKLKLDSIIINIGLSNRLNIFYYPFKKFWPEKLSFTGDAIV